MPIISRTSGTDRVSILAPPGLQPAICCDVVERGLMDNKFQPGKKIEKVSIHWLISEKIPQQYTHPYTNERSDTGELGGKPMMVSRWFTNSLHEKASLRSFLRSWRGRDFTSQQLDAGFDLEALIGVRCALNISHAQSESSGTWYANVEMATGLPQGMVKMDIPADYVRLKDRPPKEGQAVVATRGAVAETMDEEPPPHDDDDVPF